MLNKEKRIAVSCFFLSYPVCIERCNDMLNLFVGKCLVTWNAQFLAMYLLCNGERTVVPLPITCLTMGRNGVVNDGLYTLYGQKMLQMVAPMA